MDLFFFNVPLPYTSGARKIEGKDIFPPFYHLHASVSEFNQIFLNHIYKENSSSVLHGLHYRKS